MKSSPDPDADLPPADPAAAAAWNVVGAVWRRCFRLAWSAYRAGSVGVAAALVDPAGRVVATGRNRRAERDGPVGQVTNSSIAHAEVNALATVPPGDYTRYVLYTTLEPCLLCTAALRYSHVGTVRYAAADPIWYGLDRIPALNHHIARRWARREGPIDGPLSTWAAAVPLADAVHRGVASVVDTHATERPDVLRVARILAGDGYRDRSLAGALDRIWPDLTAR